MPARSGAVKFKKPVGSVKGASIKNSKKPIPVKKTPLTMVKEQVKAVAKKVKNQIAATTSAVSAPVSAPKKAALPVAKVQPATPALTKVKGGSKAAKAAVPSGPLPLGQVPQSALDGNCREVACELVSSSGGYCRLHYIKNWKKIKRKELILKEGKLNQYVEELVKKYPDKYIEAIRQDLSEDKDFSKVVTELELEESIDEFDGDGESIDNLIDNIRRDMDDDGDVF